ncbi:hypothetical protein [Microcoleus sp. herbarium12]|uniref:hypothetical protein n=1 Tax=Microcoleus sp. herbarium12 TaxID=3055437 RepID=UPI002FD630D4
MVRKTVELFQLSETFTHLKLLQRWGLGFTRRIHFRSMSLELYQILSQISSFVDRLWRFKTVRVARSRDRVLRAIPALERC